MMTRLTLIVTVLSLAMAASGQVTRDPTTAKLVTSDIDLFWKAYDKATPANDLIVYRDEYLKKGRPGLESTQVYTQCREH